MSAGGAVSIGSTVVIRHELHKARGIAQSALNVAKAARSALGNIPYVAALDEAIAGCERATMAFNDAIRISEEAERNTPARAGLTGSETHSSTPTQAESDRPSDTRVQ